MDFNAPERINQKALDILQKRFDKVEPKFVRQVVSWINKFRTTSGNLVRSKENLARLGSFKTAVNRFLEKAGYNAMVAGFLENFDEIGANTQLAQQELNGIGITKSFLNPFKRYAVNNVIAAMEGQGLNNDLINPLKGELLIAVNQGSSLTDVVTSIAGQLTSSEARQGVLKRISLQASRDALLQYDGIVNEAVRKSYKLDALLYVGSIIKDSRPQCERWVRETKNGKLGLILFEDLETEIQWADNNGTGMIPDTTPENFCQNRGGFNCRHIAYPVRSANYIKEEKPKEEAPKEPEVEQKVKVPEVKLGFDKKYDDWLNDESVVNDNVRNLINKLPKPNIISDNQIGSYYISSEKEISLKLYDSGSRTLLHEYGHHIDYLNEKNVYSNELNSSTIKDLKHQEELLNKIGIPFTQNIQFLKSVTESLDNYFLGPVQDIFDAQYLGTPHSLFGFIGHGEKYFSIEGNKEKEIFANMFQIWGSKNNEDALEMINRYFPNTYKSFFKIIENL